MARTAIAKAVSKGNGAVESGNGATLIIGAARSGTRLVRTIIASHPDFAAVPYDINFVWRYRNENAPDDELAPDLARPRVKRYIRRYIARHGRRAGVNRIVEKTVSNALRVPFCRDVFPSARFVIVIRDGRDVVESARRMWRAPVDWRYLMHKLRVFPLARSPRYALQYLRTYLSRMLTGENQVDSWGPRFAGIDYIVRTRSLLEICALQWCACVERTEDALVALPASRRHRLRFEDLVAEPRKEVRRLFDFLEAPAEQSVERAAASLVRTDTVGRGHKRLSTDELAKLERILGPTFERIGYG